MTLTTILYSMPGRETDGVTTALLYSKKKIASAKNWVLFSGSQKLLKLLNILMDLMDSAPACIV